MAELRVSRRGNNYGRRVYANPNADMRDRHESGEWAGMADFSGDRDVTRNKSNDNGMQGKKDWRLGRTASGQLPDLDDELIRQAAAMLLARTEDFLTANLCESCSASVHQRLASLAAGDAVVHNISHPKRMPDQVEDAHRVDASSLVLNADLMEERTLSKYSSQAMSRTSRRNGSVFDRLGPKLNSSTVESTFAQESPENPALNDSRVTSDSSINGSTDNAVVLVVKDAEPSKEVSLAAGRAFLEESTVKDPAKLKPQIHNRDEGANERVGSSVQEYHDSRRTSSLAVSSNDLIIKKALWSVGSGPALNTRSMSRKAVVPEPPTKLVGSACEDSDHAHIAQVVRKKDFCLIERVNGQDINILEGLELHKNVLNKDEQEELVNYVYELQELGRNQKLRRRTYSEPRKWMRGKGRVTIQFGCCYNYAMDKDGNPPGIIREEEVDPIPPKFRRVIKRLVQWQVLPPTCIPDSCIVNIYDVGDCIPPHIDHHDFVRPFCTLSLVSECDIIFGTNLKIVGPGEFKGSFSIPLPTGSVLILKGNGADVAKHSVPAVPTQRISITFRKMDPTKVPIAFVPDKELLSSQPVAMVASHLKSTSLAEDAADKPHLQSQMPPSLPNFAYKSRHQTKAFEVSEATFDSEFPALGKPSKHQK